MKSATIATEIATARTGRLPFVVQAADADQLPGDRLRALSAACHRAGLVLEFAHHPAFTNGPVLEPLVREIEGQRCYLVPPAWDLADALTRLPQALADAELPDALDSADQAFRDALDAIERALSLANDQEAARRGLQSFTARTSLRP